MKSAGFQTIKRALPFIALVVLAIGCSEQKAQLVTDTRATSYADSTADFPRLVFADGQTSMNDRCMVRMVKLNRKMPPIYVNGRPVGFC